ncbi:MAG: flavodoxin-dependent (E)-4-hydroxy-3-methylbut-2-enyl-diphosphate synthase [Erysipelotrichaceae bacterium]|nr:flavodoxin-dependent (E)-4-hydroxy-3-methylbut-2-enyl-diphosphate synthase [Erysipelotrichaceae bacterium]
MDPRKQTKPIHVGTCQIGGQDHVVIQSMCSIKTSHINEVSEQINRCAALGAEVMRCSCLDFEDAAAFRELKKRVSIPLIADIHLDYRLALASLDAGVDAIRINPGNIGDEKRVQEVVKSALAHHAPIRIGVNGGSLDKQIYQGRDTIKGEYLYQSAKKHVDLLEKYGFHDIVLSLKGSDVRETVAAYRLAAERFPYPLHLGITEAGPMETSFIRSAAGLSPLLLDGIGDTIRISLTEEPEEEVRAAARLLHDLGLKEDWPTFISCPTCGRTEVNLLPLAKKIQQYLEDHRICKTIAIMGCVVNGPGEAKHADLGAAGGNHVWVIFQGGKILRQVKDADIYDALIEEINRL